MMGNEFNYESCKVQYSSDGKNWYDLGNLTGDFIFKETMPSKIKRWFKKILWKLCSPFNPWSFSISYKKEKIKYSEKNKMPIDKLIKRWK